MNFQFSIVHIKNNIYKLFDNYNEILYDQLKNGYEVNTIANYLNTNNNLHKWMQTDYFKQLEYEIKKEYNYDLIWNNEYGTFIHKYLLFDFGKYINKNKAWKLMNLIQSPNDEAVNRIREAYHISENYYLKQLNLESYDNYN